MVLCSKRVLRITLLHGQKMDEFFLVFCLENDMHYDAMQMQWNVNECNASHAHLFFSYTGSKV